MRVPAVVGREGQERPGTLALTMLPPIICFISRVAAAKSERTWPVLYTEGKLKDMNQQEVQLANLMNRRRFLAWSGISAALFLAACGKTRSAHEPLKSDARVLALGDSLTSGVGAAPEESWPAVLANSTGWTVVNEGVSGDTSTGARQRLNALLAENRYDAILIGIGGNDMLRSVSQQTTRDNLIAMLRQAREHTPYVALIAVPAPDPLRAAFSSLSDAPVYAELAQAEQVLLVPQVYGAVLSDDSLRSDRIHANAKGYALMAERLAENLSAAGWR